jgi:hypothetical protein
MSIHVSFYVLMMLLEKNKERTENAGALSYLTSSGFKEGCIGAIKAAQECGVPYGGYCMPSFQQFGLVPVEDGVGWEEVYQKNVDSSDGTLVIGKLRGRRSYYSNDSLAGTTIPLVNYSVKRKWIHKKPDESGRSYFLL